MPVCLEELLEHLRVEEHGGHLSLLVRELGRDLLEPLHLGDRAVLRHLEGELLTDRRTHGALERALPAVLVVVVVGLLLPLLLLTLVAVEGHRLVAAALSGHLDLDHDPRDGGLDRGHVVLHLGRLLDELEAAVVGRLERHAHDLGRRLDVGDVSVADLLALRERPAPAVLGVARERGSQGEGEDERGEGKRLPHELPSSRVA